MLRHEVVQAIEERRFHLWAVETVEQGREVLTGRKAGRRTQKGTCIKGSLYEKVGTRLKELAEGLRDFGKQGDVHSRNEST